MPSASDDVWREALDGSADAWGTLFLRHHQAIYNFCFHRTGQWSVAEDLTSAVFLEAWRCRSHAQPDTAALAWLYGIATMLTRNHHRTLRRYRQALARVVSAPDVPDPADQVGDRIDAERTVARVRAALRQLAKKDVDLLDLAAAGLSYAEIAHILSIPEGTVKSRLSRARDRLGNRIARSMSADRHQGTSRELRMGRE